MYDSGQPFHPYGRGGYRGGFRGGYRGYGGGGYRGYGGGGYYDGYQRGGFRGGRGGFRGGYDGGFIEQQIGPGQGVVQPVSSAPAQQPGTVVTYTTPASAPQLYFQNPVVCTTQPTTHQGYGGVDQSQPSIEVITLPPSGQVTYAQVATPQDFASLPPQYQLVQQQQTVGAAQHPVAAQQQQQTQQAAALQPAAAVQQQPAGPQQQQQLPPQPPAAPQQQQPPAAPQQQQQPPAAPQQQQQPPAAVQQLQTAAQQQQQPPAAVQQQQLLPGTAQQPTVLQHQVAELRRENGVLKARLEELRQLSLKNAHLIEMLNMLSMGRCLFIGGQSFQNLDQAGTDVVGCVKDVIKNKYPGITLNGGDIGTIIVLSQSCVRMEFLDRKPGSAYDALLDKCKDNNENFFVRIGQSVKNLGIFKTCKFLLQNGAIDRCYIARDGYTTIRFGGENHKVRCEKDMEGLMTAQAHVFRDNIRTIGAHKPLEMKEYLP